MAGLTARTTAWLATHRSGAHTLGQIAAGLDLKPEDHAPLNAALRKLTTGKRVTRTTVPATSTKGRREIAAYQHINP